jgi:hypothetical protein
LPYDYGNDYIGPDSGSDLYRPGLGYYGADGDTIVRRNDHRDSDNVSCAGFVLLAERACNSQKTRVKMPVLKEI